ncbi:MAG: lytic transglycosylase domain-containing protein [Salaquimonas sp.]|jgi:soluble lytic murein transglycosylase|nr:lytic transglycosylase domain-containing protein [Salaquimonas sp.]
MNISMANGPIVVARRIAALRLVAGLAGASLCALAGAASAEPFKLPASGDIPVPTPRPPYSANPIPFTASTDSQTVSSVSAITRLLAQEPVVPVAGTQQLKVTPISGNLKSGLDALEAKDVGKALAIRAGMRPGSLERKVLAWAIALSGRPGIPSSEIAAIANDLPDWPGQRAMRIYSERALANEDPSARTVAAAFHGRKPESVEGAILLAKAQLALGNRKAANAAIAPFWREDVMSDAREKMILKEAGKALTRDDHRVRMAMLFYRERVKDGLALAKLSGEPHLAKAWGAVIRNDKKAAKLLAAVPAAERKDPAYVFAEMKYYRRAGDYKKAARLIAKAPRDPAKLVDADEWWVERRIMARGLIDQGDARTAYKVAANHAAESSSAQAEAEFHAGWIALRFLDNPKLAAKHFERILAVSSTPISQARGHYWLGRSLNGAARIEHYRAAAHHSGTYYGQLAAQALGMHTLPVSSPNPGAEARARFDSNELVHAIKALEAADYEWRADIIYRELAERLNDPDELALLAWRAEKRGDDTLALQVGKIAHRRGLEVDTVSWPIGAIPAKARIGDTGRALAYAIARQESAFNVSAVSPANAKGLLQLLPGTAKLMAKKTGLKYSSRKLVTDPAYNATLGSAYLSEQLDNFGNSYILTFAGYNAGPGRVKEWIETYGDPRGKPIDEVVDWVERIPFTETRNYVQRVMENYQVYKARIAKSKLDIVGDLRYGRR